MNFGRRRLVQLGIGATLSLHPDRAASKGVSTHTPGLLPRPAVSLRPFNAQFVDVAAAAGLPAPVIYGNTEIKEHIVESAGCGCAFIDCDDAGWICSSYPARTL